MWFPQIRALGLRERSTLVLAHEASKTREKTVSTDPVITEVISGWRVTGTRDDGLPVARTFKSFAGAVAFANTLLLEPRRLRAQRRRSRFARRSAARSGASATSTSAAGARA